MQFGGVMGCRSGTAVVRVAGDVDLVDQLRFRLAKAAFPKCGWIGHMPLLVNRL